jgi:hypothetical protein
MHLWTLRVRFSTFFVVWSGLIASRLAPTFGLQSPVVASLLAMGRAAVYSEANSVSAGSAATTLNPRICSHPHNTRSGVAGASIFGCCR